MAELKTGGTLVETKAEHVCVQCRTMIDVGEKAVRKQGASTGCGTHTATALYWHYPGCWNPYVRRKY
jgi:hypothetical protein